jgi:GTPase involved in cell partitioning and DNA repair
MTDAQSVTDTVQPTGNNEKETVVVVGKESVGKSELVAGLSGTTPTTGNFRGTTVDVERYETDEFVFVDTPGILLGTDTETTRTAISAVEETETVLLVVPATNIDDDLEALLPLVQGKVGAIAVTFWDKVENPTEARDELNALAEDLGVPLAPADARNVSRVATDGGSAAIDGLKAVSSSARSATLTSSRGGFTDRQVFISTRRKRFSSIRFSARSSVLPCSCCLPQLQSTSQTLRLPNSPPE